ncbi:MAG: adenine-specific methyltransferase EcoRI family protein [Selenomonadaceae bacterium]|nr:adenine-specific methyltransferase EcoRI family protein [Selenomonadaceae bacterium]
MAGNKNLNSAARAKKDEFYTQMDDITAELRYYMNFFKGKVVLCNCDDPYESEFFKYFAIFFNTLGLKKLIATCYAGSPIVQTELDFWGTANENPTFDKRKTAIKLEVNEVKDFNGDGRTDLADVKWLLENNSNVVTYLDGNGDFRSPECVEALREADVVVTNPPFSLFREYVKQLIDNDKKFLIIGNQNAITYKEIFKLFMDNKIWLGASIHSGDRKFWVPDDYPLNAATCGVDESGRKFINVKGVRWFTNIDYIQRHEDIILTRRYYKDPSLYPHYDNYDAIEVSKTAEIPVDYFGVMGVPITFLDKYNPEQFEIIGMAKRGAGDPALRSKVYTANDSPNYSDLNAGPVLLRDGKLKNTYPRILIRRRQHEN